MFNSFHSRVEFGTILEDLRNFGGGLNPPHTPLGTPLALRHAGVCGSGVTAPNINLGTRQPRKVSLSFRSFLSPIVHNKREDLHNTYSSPNIVSAIKDWVHMYHAREIREMDTSFPSAHLNGRNYFGRSGNRWKDDTKMGITRQEMWRSGLWNVTACCNKRFTADRNVRSTNHVFDHHLLFDLLRLRPDQLRTLKYKPGKSLTRVNINLEIH